jgi:1-acyl-sn-glycerol-3-phosphate acyltransferase
VGRSRVEGGTRSPLRRYFAAVPTPFYTFIGFCSWPIMKGLYRLEVRGFDKLPTAGGFVLAANHTSNFDPWPLGFPLWPRRQLHFMAKVELFNPILGPLLRMGGAFPVRRGEQDVQAVEMAVRLCREGGIVAMFPEGTRRTKGVRKKFEAKPRTGSARIALAAGVPLIPAAIKGTDRLARVPKLKIAYGRGIPVADLSMLVPRDAARAATERLMAEINELHATL